MNVVEELKKELISLAHEKELCISFTTQNINTYTAKSRVYVSNGEAGNCTSKNVLIVREFKGTHHDGTTTRCTRYRAYDEMKNFLINYWTPAIVSKRVEKQ